LELKDKFYYYPRDFNRTRNDYLAEADLKLQAKKAGEKLPYVRATRVDFLEEPQKAAEIAILDALKKPEAQKYIESGEGTQTFRTRSGVYDDMDQTAITALKGKNPHQAVDALNRMIFKVVGKGESVTVTVVQSQANKALEDENFILKGQLDDSYQHWKDVFKWLSGETDPLKVTERIKQIQDKFDADTVSTAATQQ
jgi:hypothetical protein